MLLEMKRARLGEEDTAACVKGKLNWGQKVMGMGHSVYKTLLYLGDPFR
jgi:citrate synthase